MPTLRVFSGFDVSLSDANMKAAAVTIPRTARDARAEVNTASDGWEVQSTEDVSPAACASDLCIHGVCFVQTNCCVVSLHHCHSVLP